MNTHPVKEETEKTPDFVDFSSGKRLAYHLSEGKNPGIVFLGGFNSDMNGGKAIAMEARCKEEGRRFLRFNYSGHGSSSSHFEDGTIGQWKQDAIDMIDRLAPGPNILIGSSMGGWIMLLVALARPDTITGLVGIASAPDFTEELLWDTATPDQKKQLAETGRVEIAPCMPDQSPYPITMKLIEEGRNHLLLRNPIPLSMPMRLLHGIRDEDVPYSVSQRLLDTVTSTDARLTLVKNASHRFSEPEQIELIWQQVKSLTK